MSSSLTTFTTCCPGVRLSETSAPKHRSRVRSMKRSTTLKWTSASKRAYRISRIASATSSSVSRPFPLSRPKIPSKRSVSDSNIRLVRLPVSVLSIFYGLSHHRTMLPRIAQDQNRQGRGRLHPDQRASQAIQVLVQSQKLFRPWLIRLVW